MRDCPPEIGGARVVCFTPIDARHRHTGQTRHGGLWGAAAGLAIVYSEGEGAFYLFGCDAEWSCLADRWHETLDQAMAQAEIEYEGVTKTWVIRPAETTDLP